MARRAKFEDEEIVVATQGVATGDYTIARGTRLRGNHPVVQAVPSVFVSDGIPESEWPSMWASLPEPNNESSYPQPEPIPDEEAAVAVESFSVGERNIPRGARLRRDDKLVKAHPQLFRTPALPVG